MTVNSPIKILEKCRVAPPPEDDDALAELTLPLTFYDLQWLALPPIHDLNFYRFPNPNPIPIPTIISSIKSSLSLVLKHFLPLAGKLISPAHPEDNNEMPEFRYVKGDSVSLTIAESNMDFDYLVGDHQKDLHLFCDLLPQLHQPIFLTSAATQFASPLLALQVTVFPNSGISIGRTLLHVIGDAPSFTNFSESWSSINKFKFSGDSLKLCYDRSVVQDPFDLRSKILSNIKQFKSQQQRSCVKIPNPIIYKDEIQATFILHKCDIMKLKSFVASKRTSGSISNGNHNVWSTFTVACALVWSCLSKSLDYVKEEEDVEVADDKQEYLLAYINCRERYDMRIPQNYFGNCTVPCIVRSTHGKLAGNEGFLVAATTIRDAIQKRLQDKEGFLKGDWLADTYTQTIAVAPGMLEIDGATQHNVYNNDADFDWGELVKHVCTVPINSSEIVLGITLSKRFEGARELSMTLPKKRMDAFTAILTDSIRRIHEFVLAEMSVQNGNNSKMISQKIAMEASSKK